MAPKIIFALETEMSDTGAALHVPHGCRQPKFDAGTGTES
jgi:hypothetical protein